MEIKSHKIIKTSSKSGSKLQFGVIAGSMVSWYEKNKRILPWRTTDNPYLIYLSEIILQQTRISQGLPYYIRFKKNFPTVYHLARADEDRVLKLWEGLGYYTRARNMHKTARIIINDYSGRFPAKYDELLRLPGIGRYTAAAIASISFREKVPVIDGNVLRILSRIFGIRDDISGNKGKKTIEEYAWKLMPESDPGVFNQSVMELGALICLPKKPLCINCPVNRYCTANSKQIQHQLPVKTRKNKKKGRYFNYFIIRFKDRFILSKRGENDIWKGLYEFYLVETKSNHTQEAFQDEFISDILLNERIHKISHSYTSVLTHQQIRIRFIELFITSGKSMKKITKSGHWKLYTAEEVKNLPKPVPLVRFLKEMNY